MLSFLLDRSGLRRISLYHYEIIHLVTMSVARSPFTERNNLLCVMFKNIGVRISQFIIVASLKQPQCATLLSFFAAISPSPKIFVCGSLAGKISQVPLGFWSFITCQASRIDLPSFSTYRYNHLPCSICIALGNGGAIFQSRKKQTFLGSQAIKTFLIKTIRSRIKSTTTEIKES